MRRGALACAALAVFAERFALRARVPDDWDATGFVRAIGEFDLEKLQPHFPGYPVYVALARAAHFIGLAPLDAATAVSAAASAATAVGVWRLARASSEAAAWCALALYAAASLPWLDGGAASSDATATALATWAFVALAERRAGLGALAIALMLGARASYWPLALSWAIGLLLRGGSWRAALAFFSVGSAIWAVPLLALVGARRYLALGRAHLGGHFQSWGGSIATRPGLGLRSLVFARDLFFDGLAPRAWALAALLALATVGVALRPPERRAQAWAALVFAPYALWVLLAQNVVEQPRHLLPLVVLVVIALAWSARRALVVTLPAIALAASAPLAWAHAHEAPAAAQAADWLAARAQSAGGSVAVFGGASIRFFENLAGVGAHPRTWLSEVDVDLERLDSLPREIWITDEVELDAARAPRVSDGPRFCRDARLDRARPCLALRRYTIGGTMP